MLSQKQVTVKPEIYQQMELFGKDCLPEKTVDEVAGELLELGIKTVELQVTAKWMLQSNQNI
jgi:hypothetical protein